MPPRELHVLGIDPGGTTGWCKLTIPRVSIVDGEPGTILDQQVGEFAGYEHDQAYEIAALCRTVQGLAYKIGPALVVEDWDQDPSFKSTDPEVLSPCRIGAMLTYVYYRTKLMNDARLVFQSRVMAKSTATDARLKRWGLYRRGSDHIKDATRHAIVAIRRAKQDPELAEAFWDLNGT